MTITYKEKNKIFIIIKYLVIKKYNTYIIKGSHIDIYITIYGR